MQQRGGAPAKGAFIAGDARPASGDSPSRGVLAGHFRTPYRAVDVETVGPLSPEPGYFTFGGVVCYGRCSGASPSRRAAAALPEAGPARIARDGTIQLPFDLDEVVDNLRLERYAQPPRHALERLTAGLLARRAYYLIRPLLPVGIRRHLQKLRLMGWDRVAFPRWPVDTSVDDLLKEVLRAALEHDPSRSIPFIWFWPEGARSCAMITHDVEGQHGRDFCPTLMDLDDEFGVPAAFQIVPDGTAGHATALFETLRTRGFEVNVHDLSHDGSLFGSERLFAEKAALINSYARIFESAGFRSGAMYRQQKWFGALDFSYDMSVPNVAHLEPQAGGCCTTFPHFIGDILELPLTTTQDYSLFHILGDYSTELWRRQIARILETHGLISFIAHPDYLAAPRAFAVYRELLALLSELRAAGETWLAAPGEINRWWRNRRTMVLVDEGGAWRIEGRDSNRARVAYARLENGRVRFDITPSAPCDARRGRRKRTRLPGR